MVVMCLVASNVKFIDLVVMFIVASNVELIAYVGGWILVCKHQVWHQKWNNTKWIIKNHYVLPNFMIYFTHTWYWRQWRTKTPYDMSNKMRKKLKQLNQLLKFSCPTKHSPNIIPKCNHQPKIYVCKLLWIYVMIYFHICAK